MQRVNLSTALLTTVLYLPVAVLAMGPGIPPEVANAIDHCAEARQVTTQENEQQARAYCGEAMESLQGLPGEQVMIKAMAATSPEGKNWPWHHPTVLTEHGGDAQDRKRYREAWQQAKADADEMLEAHQRRTAADATQGTADTAARQCDTQDCFVQAVQQCESASHHGGNEQGARARYAVMGPLEDGTCRLSFTYTSNPNAELVDKPLTFVLNPERPVEPQLKAAVSSCLTHRPDDFQCSGPLYEAVTEMSSQREH